MQKESFDFSFGNFKVVIEDSKVSVDGGSWPFNFAFDLYDIDQNVTKQVSRILNGFLSENTGDPFLMDRGDGYEWWIPGNHFAPDAVIIVREWLESTGEDYHYKKEGTSSWFHMYQTDLVKGFFGSLHEDSPHDTFVHNDDGEYYTVVGCSMTPEDGEWV